MRLLALLGSFTHHNGQSTPEHLRAGYSNSAWDSKSRSQLRTRSCDFNAHLTFHGLPRAMNTSLCYDVRNTVLQRRNFSFRLAQFEWKVSVHLLSLAPAFLLFLLIISECVAQCRGAIHVCAHAVITQSHAWKPAFPILQSYIFPGNNMFVTQHWFESQ